MKKNRHLAVIELCCFGFCCYEHLPLLHRLLAGMAKVKKAGKPQWCMHGESENDGLTITTRGAAWQALCRTEKSAQQRCRYPTAPKANGEPFDLPQREHGGRCKTRPITTNESRCCLRIGNFSLGICCAKFRKAHAHNWSST
ncbi:hypothetical protein [Massilia sp. PWRC2]|uniref:hypothetical protein n=1 Tax=Massilia sp. PWRC2 TaxID=2804626 RepID=UPI003CED7BB7